MGTMTGGVASGSAVVAIDAGNSKTDVAVVRVDGDVLSVVRTRGHRPHTTGLDSAVSSLKAAVDSALTQAGNPPVVVLGAYAANADFPVEERELLARLRGWGVAATTRVGNDTFALLRSALREPVGVAVVCGAGINCVGLGRRGQVARFPSIGTLAGDWGGGEALAIQAMYYACRDEDGRGAQTLLSTSIAQHFGLESTLRVAQAVHLKELAEKRLHDLVPLVFQAAAAGDRIAADLVARQAREVAILATVALRKVDLIDTEATVVLGGGILAAGHESLNGAVRRHIAEAAPLARVVIPDLSPLYGAILLCFDELPFTETSKEAAESRTRSRLAISRFTQPVPTLSH